VRQARAELETVAGGIRASVPDLPRDRGFYAERAGQLSPFLRKMAIPAFLLLLTVTFLVLLTACANVANLMLARATTRSQEIATRLAVGAGRGRLIRQLMTESLLLALGGGVLGVALVELAGRYIAGYRLPLPVPIDLSMSVDYRVVLFSTALSVVTGIAFGLVPAFRAARPDLIASIRSDGGNPAGLRRFGLRNTLVVAQVGISGVLVICSGLFLRSLGAAHGIDSGMHARNLTLVRFDPALSRHDQQQTHRLLLDVLRDVESLPGVRSASVTNVLPLSLGGNSTHVGAEGPGRDDEAEPSAVMAIGPRYFETLGISILAGAGFRPVSSTEPVAIVNQELARRLYPNQNALGRDVWEGGGRARIVGVAANSKYRMMQESEVTPILYKPILDSYAAEGSFGGITLIVRSAQDAGSPGELIRARLLARDPELVVNLAGTMESHVRESMFLPRLAASLFGLCGGVGLLIASIGVYGVISFAVARRRREIGIRMALGARASQIVRMVLWQGAAVVLVGIAIGVAGGLALARAAGSLIYGVSATDTVTFIVVPVILLSVGLLATAIPARRAAMLDPNRTLRAK
jgi:predicted permease